MDMTSLCEASIWIVDVTRFCKSRFWACWELIYELVLIEPSKLSERSPIPRSFIKRRDGIGFEISQYVSEQIFSHIIGIHSIAPRTFFTIDRWNIMTKIWININRGIGPIVVVKSFLSLLFLCDDGSVLFSWENVDWRVLKIGQVGNHTLTFVLVCDFDTLCSLSLLKREIISIWTTDDEPCSFDQIWIDNMELSGCVRPAWNSWDSDWVGQSAHWL